MRLLLTLTVIGIFAGGYWYFVMAPTAPQIKKEIADHSSLIEKEIPLVTMNTEHYDEPTKNILIVATTPKISLVSVPQIAQNINSAVASRADLLMRDFLGGISTSSTRAGDTIGNFNTFALGFTTATVTEKFIAWNIDTSYQYAAMPIASSTISFIAFRLDDGAIIDKEQLAQLK